MKSRKIRLSNTFVSYYVRVENNQHFHLLLTETRYDLLVLRQFFLKYFYRSFGTREWCHFGVGGVMGKMAVLRDPIEISKSILA